jgi:glycosyltransferase involved in cell wall biosynthesis
MSRCVTVGIANLLAQHGVPENKLIVIGNGVDTDEMRPLPGTESSPTGSNIGVKRLGFIGGLVNWQGVECAIQAMAQLRDIEGLELLIAGDGPERLKLEALAKKLTLTGRVHFLGYVPREKAVDVINSFNIALAPFTRRRNDEIGLSPIKIRDYAATGRIVVAAQIDGIKELAADGWLFTHRPDDPKDLANIVRQLLRCPAQERVALSRRARAYAKAHFDWRQISAKVAHYL